MTTTFDINHEATALYLQKMQDFLLNEGKDIKPPRGKFADVVEQIRKADIKPGPDTAKLYRMFQHRAERFAKRTETEAYAYDGLFLKMFENDNTILEAMLKHVIAPEGKIAPDAKALKRNIKERTPDKHKLVDPTHPDNPLNAFFSSMLGIDYRPMQRNNVPYIAFSGPENKGRVCLRMGTQTHGGDRLNRIFQRYLLANARRSKKEGRSDDDYDYVYFNLLRRPEAGFSPIERYAEGKRTTTLEKLNDSRGLKAAVITLPADGEFLTGKFHMHDGKVEGVPQQTHLTALLDDIADSIRGNKNDFYFSTEVKERLFGKNLKDLDKQIAAMFLRTLQECGIPPDATTVGPEARAAIMFHFVKYQLTNYILDTLNPKAYNMTCKDGIDRGGVQTLWYHLNMRFQMSQTDPTIKPLSLAEFHQFLDTAAMVVKFRPLNAHRNLFWVAMNERMKDENFAKAHPWAFDWLAANKPAHLQEGILAKPKVPKKPDKPQDDLQDLLIAPDNPKPELRAPPITRSLSKPQTVVTTDPQLSLKEFLSHVDQDDFKKTHFIKDKIVTSGSGGITSKATIALATGDAPTQVCKLQIEQMPQGGVQVSMDKIANEQERKLALQRTCQLMVDSLPPNHEIKIPPHSPDEADLKKFLNEAFKTRCEKEQLEHKENQFYLPPKTSELRKPTLDT